MIRKQGKTLFNMNYPFSKRAAVLGMLFLFLLMVTAPAAAQPAGISADDSLLQKFSIEELVQLKKMLEVERQRLIREQEKDIKSGIEISEEFLNQTEDDQQNQDMILIRVAEYFIDQAQQDYEVKVEEYNRRYDEYDRRQMLYEAGEISEEPQQPQFPKRDYSEAIRIYNLILKNFPGSDLADDALYNKAYLLEEMEDEQQAQHFYQELIEQYPESNYAPEAYMQMADYYFQPRLDQSREETISNLHKAAQLYQSVLRYKNSPRYDEALYKLGWSYYRLAAEDPSYYKDAVYYYTLVVKDVDDFREWDPEGAYIKSNIMPEALQYIAASFIDTTYAAQPVARASQYIQQLGKPHYGRDILENMGDLYTRIVDYSKAVEAYRTLLELYPDYIYAPQIRKKIADAYTLANRPQEAYQERMALFNAYNPTTDWYIEIDEGDRDDRVVILDEASSLTEEALRANLIFELNKARELEESNGDSLGAYDEFARLATLYLDTYPTHENAYEINWSLAYVLDTELKRYYDAFEQYIRVSSDYLEDDHRKDAATNAIAVSQTAVNALRAERDSTKISGMENALQNARELNEAEKMLAEAYDNYILLFPEDEQTATYLADAGGLYYRHRKYDLAQKYYKTMVIRFPEAREKNIGLLSLMNSYFFLGKFEDAEFVARQVLNSPEVPEED
ncbi:MAG: tetratricopeptide repeat protein, partial [Calditrichia bacterium]